MSKRTVSRSVDSIYVDENEARFSGRIPVDDVDAGQMVLDEEHLILVYCRVTPPTFGSTKDGDLKRIDVLKPIELHVVADNDDAGALMAKYGFFLPAPPAPEPEGVKDGEIIEGPEFVVAPVSFSPVPTHVDEPDPEPEPEDFTVEGESEPEPEFTGTDEDEDEDDVIDRLIAEAKRLRDAPAEDEDDDPYGINDFMERETSAA